MAVAVLTALRESRVHTCLRVKDGGGGVAHAPRFGHHPMYRDRLKSLYVVARNFFLLLLNFSAWLCLDVA